MNQAFSYLDVVIACVAVLVMATSMVLTLTHLTLTALKKRKEILIVSLGKLLENVGLSHENAGKIATGIVEDPKVKEQGGSVIKREQLVKILLDKAVSSPELKTALGVDDPAAMLKSLRDRVLQLEATSPELADHTRRTKAIVENALNKEGQAVMDGIVKIMSGFDRACDQMTHAIKTKARFWTILFSAVVAIALPLDSIGIVKQLASHPAEVQQLVATAKGLKDPQASVPEDDLGKLQQRIKAQTKQITNPALGIEPFAVFTSNFWSLGIALRVIGILISIALMSLGAPFWFDALKNLLALRPSLASKETVERAERGTTTKSA